MANGTVVLIPQIGANVIQAGQGIPGTVIQPAGTVQYVQYVGQPVGSLNNQPQSNHQVGWMEKFIKVETKTLGAIQIMIGLLHIGFGGVSLALPYILIPTIGGYPFWGGIFFIISGSLSVSAEKRLTASQVRCTLGMNITSAVMALIGIILYIADLSVHAGVPGFDYNYNDGNNYGWMKAVGTGFSVILLFFSMLEFCITVSTAHFGCQAICCTGDPATVYVPYTFSGGDVAFPEGNLPAAAAPPAYDSVDFSKTE